MKTETRKQRKSQQVAMLLASSQGRIFSVDFVKRTTGELRTMVCRTGVSKGVNGKGQSFDPAKKNLMTVWDTQKGAFRMINLESVQAMRVDGVQYDLN